eukprot:37995-Pyramimonas_sp.AAC.1
MVKALLTSSLPGFGSKGVECRPLTWGRFRAEASAVGCRPRDADRAIASAGSIVRLVRQLQLDPELGRLTM